MQPPAPAHGEPERLASRVLHSGKIFRLLAERVRLPSGRLQDVDVVEHPGAVAVAALDDLGRLLLVRQYRHAVGRVTLEVPAGRLEPGEAPLDTAQRELEEETGFRARSWRPLRSFLPAPGFCSERVHLFAAEDLLEVGEGALAADADEELELVRLFPAEAAEQSDDAKTLLAIACLFAGPLPPPHAAR